MNEELRCYTFTNFYLSSIQQGIQSTHSVVELFNKYLISEGWVNGCAEQINEWASMWKTMICLNGGDAYGVNQIYSFFNSLADNPYPFASFCESESALDGTMTSVAIILPARIFETAGLMREHQLPKGVHYTHDRLIKEHRFSFSHIDGGVDRTETYSQWEYELMKKLNECALAR